MRQIKFRVWDSTQNKYTNPTISYTDGQWFVFGHVYLMGEKGLILEQFTGLLDSEGREIYEGDILKFNNLHYEVLWRDYKWVATCPNYNRYHWPTFDPFYGARAAKIVGNIHQNSELLAA